MQDRQQKGFILLPVIVAISLVAAIAFWVNSQSGMDINQAAGAAELDQAYYLAEAGLQHGQWSLNHSNCSSVADLSNEPFAGASYSVVFTPSGPSEVSIVSTGSAGGTSRTLVMGNQSYNTPLTTVVLQPGNEGEDSLIFAEEFPGITYGSADYLLVSEKFNRHQRSLLRFNLQNIPVGATIESAVLELELFSVGAGFSPMVSAHRVREPWSEQQATWLNAATPTPWGSAGGSFDATVSASAPLPNVGKVQLDLTSLVARWVDRSLSNNGLILLGSPNLVNATFASSDSAWSSNRPKLTITYSCDCTLGCGGGSCNASFTPNNTLWSFPGTSYGFNNLEGVAFLAEGKTFRGVTAPAGGGWLSLDRSAELVLTDSSGSELSRCSLNVGTDLSSDITPISSGLWQDHWAVTLNGNPDRVVFIDSNCAVLGEFSTSAFGSTMPRGVGFIGTTDSGSFEGSLAITDTSGDRLYLTDQAGNLQAVRDISNFAKNAQGVTHLPDTDTLLLVDTDSDKAYFVDFVNFSGFPQRQYDLAPFGVTAPSAVAIDPLSCDHVIGTSNPSMVLDLNEIDQSGLPATQQLEPSADATIDQGNPAANYGSDTELRIGTDPLARHSLSLLKFDVTPIPDGAPVSSATLRLYVPTKDGTGLMTHGLYRVTAPWDENTVTWSNSGGGSYDPLQLDQNKEHLRTGWYEWTVPNSLVEDWMSGAIPNEGLVIKLESSNAGKMLRGNSREVGSSELRPQLVLEYVNP